MNRAVLNYRLTNLMRGAFRDRAAVVASSWAEREVFFNEPGRVGKLSFHERKYLREPLDFYSNDSLFDMIMCFGTRTGKTTVMFAGTAYKVFHKAIRLLFVKPTAKGTAGAESDARTRFLPMMRSSPILRGLIPSGATRHDFKTAQQILRNGSIIDWTGSNSVANLAGNSMEVVNQDEVDKFNMTRRRDTHGNVVEADAADLADERTKEFRFPKRVKSSTPTLEGGRIWAELMKTDIRRWFVPCPLCGRDKPKEKMVVLAWSERFTILPTLNALDGKPIPLAFASWDEDAKMPDGSWDFERVRRSAGYLCPHCKGKFGDESKSWMDENGEWRPTKYGIPNTVGYHLPSMYSFHEQVSVGRLAVEFLESISSVEGPRNFVNSRLAEPYMLQGIASDKAGRVGKHIEVTAEWINILSVDYQQKAPYIWALVRAWNGSNKTHGITYRSLNQWEEVDQIQEDYSIIPQAVIVDSGFSYAEVLQNCANIKQENRCSLLEAVQDAKPECNGWNPAKAFGGKTLYRQENGLFLPYRLKRGVDPYSGTDLANQMQIELLEYVSDIFEDMMENIRLGKTGLEWTISKEMDTDEYHRHMAGKIRKFSNKDPNVYKWETIRTDYPDHIHSCELLNFVLAYRLQLISFDAIQVKRGNSIKKNQ